METMDVRRLGLILAIQAEIDGMKAQNQYLSNINENIQFHKEDFQEKAEELKNLSHCHDEQL